MRILLNFIIKQISRIVSVWQRFLFRYYRFCLLIKAWLYGHEIMIPESCRLAVPIVCNGRGSVLLGDNVFLGFRNAPRIGNGSILLQSRKQNAVIAIGKGTNTSNNISIISCLSVSVGDDCRIGDLVAIYDCDFHEINPETRNNSDGEIIPVKIGNNVWLGSRVTILKGVTIGDGSVIAAGSIVVKSIPERSLAAGIPAKVIRRI